MNRRLFLSAAAGAPLAAAASHASQPPEAIPVIDAHQHLWDRSRFRLPWLAGQAHLDRDFLPKDYAEAAEGIPVTKAVYLEVDVDPAQQVAEAEHLLELIRTRAGATAAAVISGRPDDSGFRAYLKRFKDAPEIKGVRRVLHSAETPAGYALRESFLAGIRALGEVGLSFDICPRGAELPDMIKLVDACPDTTFVLDHLGNPNLADLSAWRGHLASLAERPKVWCKVSGIVASAPEGWTAATLAPAVNHAISCFGIDRVLFGSDWPVCTARATFRQWYAVLQAIVAERSAADRRKLFHDNAIRCYRLG